MGQGRAAGRAGRAGRRQSGGRQGEGRQARTGRAGGGGEREAVSGEAEAGRPAGGRGSAGARHRLSGRPRSFPVAWRPGHRQSGGHGIRTHNSFRSTTFPVWPLTIRLPSKRMFFCLGTPLGTPQTGLARLRRTTPHAQISRRVYPSAFSPQRPSLPAVFSGFSGSRYPEGAPERSGGTQGCRRGTQGVRRGTQWTASMRRPNGSRRGAGKVGCLIRQATSRIAPVRR